MYIDITTYFYLCNGIWKIKHNLFIYLFCVCGGGVVVVVGGGGDKKVMLIQLYPWLLINRNWKC